MGGIVSNNNINSDSCSNQEPCIQNSHHGNNHKTKQYVDGSFGGVFPLHGVCSDSAYVWW